MPDEEDVVLASAIERFQSGDIDGAIQELHDAAEADPADLRIPLTLAKLLMRQGQFVQAEELLMSLPEQKRSESDIANLLVHLGFIRAAEQAPAADELLATLEVNTNAHEARYQLASLLLLNDETEAALEQLLVLLQCEPSFRNGIARRGMSAILDMLGPDDDIAREYRQQMHSLTH